jgi:transposase
LHEALQQARKREKTEEFKEEYKKMSGIEGTISQGVRAFGVKRSRYIGRAKTHLQRLAIAAAMFGMCGTLQGPNARGRRAGEVRRDL